MYIYTILMQALYNKVYRQGKRQGSDPDRLRISNKINYLQQGGNVRISGEKTRKIWQNQA